MSLLRAIARDFWRKSYVKCHFCVSPRRWKLAPRIMPLSYPGYSVNHDNLKYIFVFAINDFFYKILRKKGWFFQNFYFRHCLFTTFRRSCAKKPRKLIEICDLNIPQIDTRSKATSLARVSGYFSRREWKCTVVNVLTADWEIIVSASPQPCPSTSRSNFQRETAALLQARPANSFLACVTADAK